MVHDIVIALKEQIALQIASTAYGKGPPSDSCCLAQTLKAVARAQIRANPDVVSEDVAHTIIQPQILRIDSEMLNFKQGRLAFRRRRDVSLHRR